MSLNKDVNRHDKTTQQNCKRMTMMMAILFMLIQLLCVFGELPGGCVGDEDDGDADDDDGDDCHDDGPGDVGRCVR